MVLLYASYTLVSRTRFKEVVFFEALQKFMKIPFHYVGANTKFLTDLINDLGFGTTAFQHFEDSGPHNVDREHLAMVNIENDGSVAFPSASHPFGNLQQRAPPFRTV